MPNHFHLMVSVNNLELPIMNKPDNISEGATLSRTLTAAAKKISFNHSIGIMLASFTRAINKQNGTSGSLLRQKTKSECLKLSEIELLK